MPETTIKTQDFKTWKSTSELLAKIIKVCHKLVLVNLREYLNDPLKQKREYSYKAAVSDFLLRASLLVVVVWSPRTVS